MYTEEDIQKLREYDGTRESVIRLSVELNKSPKSVEGKLVALGIYKKPPKLTKAGKPVELKRDIQKDINDAFGLNLETLVKVEREELRILRDAIMNPLNLRALLVDLAD